VSNYTAYRIEHQNEAKAAVAAKSKTVAGQARVAQ